MKWLALLLLGCASVPVVVRPRQPCPTPVEADADEVAVKALLTSFVEAVDRRDFERALGLLSDDWRQRYSASRFEADFALEPQGRVLVDRLRASLRGEVLINTDTATLRVASNRSVLVAKQAGRWRLASLDQP